MTTAELITAECNAIKCMLLEKNARYGDSALSPRRIFSRADAIDQIKVRIDDKLSRIATMGPDSEDEDTVADLIGYLVLLRVARRLVAPALNSATAVASGYVVPPLDDGDDDPAVVHIVPDKTSRAAIGPLPKIDEMCKRPDVVREAYESVRALPDECLGALCGRAGR